MAGLGIGLAASKRVTEPTGESKFVLGIFVSQLVPGSAAEVDGRLREGAEIMEINGHNVIGLDREVVISYLKQIPQGGQVALQVSQEMRQAKQTAL